MWLETSILQLNGDAIRLSCAVAVHMAAYSIAIGLYCLGYSDFQVDVRHLQAFEYRKDGSFATEVVVDCKDMSAPLSDAQSLHHLPMLMRYQFCINPSTRYRAASSLS